MNFVRKAIDLFNENETSVEGKIIVEDVSDEKENSKVFIHY